MFERCSNVLVSSSRLFHLERNANVRMIIRDLARNDFKVECRHLWEKMVLMEGLGAVQTLPVITTHHAPNRLASGQILEKYGWGRKITRRSLSANMLTDPCSSSLSCFPLFHLQDSSDLFNKTCISETFTTLVFPEMINPKHLWCLREMYMKLRVFNSL